MRCSFASDIVAARRFESPGTRPGQPRRCGVALLSLTVLLLGFVNWATAGEAAVAKIEEDWRVEVDTPDPDVHAPQVSTVLSPNSSLSGHYAVFELNHRSLPSYSAGGVQVQLWDGDAEVNNGSLPADGLLSTADEVVTFTTSMSVAGGTLRYKVPGGNSTTWGSFGGDSHLSKSVPTALTDLGAYSPEFSVANSYVGVGAHRVKKVVLTEVRYYAADGTLLKRDTTTRVAHEHNSGS